MEINGTDARFIVTVREKSLLESPFFHFRLSVDMGGSEQNNNESGGKIKRAPWYKRGGFDKIIGKSAGSAHGLGAVYAEEAEKRRMSAALKIPDVDIFEIMPSGVWLEADYEDFAALDDHMAEFDFEMDDEQAMEIDHIFDDPDDTDFDFDDYGDTPANADYDSDFSDAGGSFFLGENSLSERAAQGDGARNLLAWRSDGGKYGRQSDGIPLWAKENFEFKTAGKIFRRNGTLEFIYDESEITGYKKSFVKILFSPPKPGIVVMEKEHISGFPFRDGSVSQLKKTYTIEKGKRHYIAEECRYFGDSAAVYTKCGGFVNTLSENGGVFSAEYITEYNGIGIRLMQYRLKVETDGT